MSMGGCLLLLRFSMKRVSIKDRDSFSPATCVSTDEFLHLRYGGNRTRAEETSKSHKVFDLNHSADRVYTIGTEGSHHMDLGPA